MSEVAQRSDEVYITVDLPDAKDVTYKIEPEGRFIFSATKDGAPYEVDKELYDKINTKESKCNIGARSTSFVIKKEEKKWWDRLMKQEGKPPAFIKLDWDKWIDEEGEYEQAQADLSNMNISKGSKGKGQTRKGKGAMQWLRSLNCLGKQ